MFSVETYCLPNLCCLNNGLKVDDVAIAVEQFCVLKLCLLLSSAHHQVCTIIISLKVAVDLEQTL